MFLRAALIAVPVGVALMAALLLSVGTTHGETCPDADDPPTPTEVAVTAVPVVATSTAAEYFVLYVSHDADGETVEYPVQVALGADGTTTLAENLSALPSESYRVEKYLVADPADVDGDCVDDITELNDPAGMNPVNGAARVGRSAVIISGHAAFQELSQQDRGDEYYEQPEGRTGLDRVSRTKFVMAGLDTNRPRVFFMDISPDIHHKDFVEAAGLEWNEIVRGEIVHLPHLAASDGSQGSYSFFLSPYAYQHSFDTMNRVYTLLAASMPLLDDNLALHLRNYELPYSQDLLPLYKGSRIDLVYDDDIFAEITFQALNTGIGYGLLRVADPDETPHPHDIVIYEALPNNLANVAGIISTEPQTPLSHVNLRAVQNGVPNAFIRGAVEDTDIAALIDSYVHYRVTGDGWTLRAATPEEVESNYAGSRPAQFQIPERDLSVTSITPLGSISFGDWESFGVKAANLAVLKSLSYPSPKASFPDGFAVPFHFYHEFMKANGFYQDIKEMLADPEFQADFEVQEAKLKKLRKKIKKGDTPGWIETALVAMHAAYPEGTSLRYRSSTNNEDLPGFNGAGLYDSKTQHPEETEEDGISKSLKQVYASLWNFEAFAQREFHRVDHFQTAMGVLVHPNYSDELANGVAATFDPLYDEEGWYYVNTQLGEDLVTNPEAQSAPEEILLHSYKASTVLATSNLVPRGEMLLSETQRHQLRSHLEVIHDEFNELYDPEPGEPFAMEIEFKITSANVLSIKQARPWVFYDAPPPSGNNLATGEPTISGSAQVDATLTADTSEIADADGLENSTFGYRWSADGSGIPGATGSTYTPKDDDAGKTIRVRVSFTDGAGNGEALLSAPTPTVAARPNSPATGAPTISGTVRVGETLTAGAAGIADTDGLTSVAYSYQWIRNDGSSDTDIRDETGATYTVAPADAARTIKVRATFTDDAGNEESLVSEATAQAPAIWTGTVTVGSDPDGSDWTGYSLFNGGMGSIKAPDFELGGVKYAVQFVTHNQSGLYLGLKSELAAAFSLYVAPASFESTGGSFRKGDNSFIYHWQGADPDWSIGEDVAVALFDATETETAEETPANSPATGAPAISGTAQAGETLTASASGIADADGLTGVSYSYQWIRNDGATDTDISGATSSTYTLADDDEGTTIKVKVSFIDDAGHDETLTSAATSEVSAAPSPLTVSLENSPASHNGTDVFTFQIRFSEELKLSYKTLRDHAFTVDRGTVKQAKRQVKGSNIGWTVTVEPGSDSAVRIVLPSTTDCDSPGAICTQDGRKLSNSLDFTVSGPS